MGKRADTAGPDKGGSAASGAQQVTVSFAPGARAARVAPGDTLLSAAWKAGAGIKAVCGGRGKCGTCRVELDHQALAGGALSAPTDQETAVLPEEFRGGSHRLACLAQVNTDVAVTVPPESQAEKHPPRKPYAVRRIALEPLVARVTIDIDAPAALPLRALATRIREALVRACGAGIGPIAPQVLAEFSHRSGFDTVRRLTVALYGGTEILQILPGERSGTCGIALDIGTTSLAMFLCNLGSGDIVAVKTAANPQAAYGEDVISRMTHINQDPRVLAALQSLLVAEVNRMIAEAVADCGIDRDDILEVVAVGNPTMQHLLLGVNPEPLGRGPYQPVWREAALLCAAQIGIDIAPGARLFVFPVVSGYIGGDTLAAVLTRGADFYQGVKLLIDIGTNGEVVLAKNGELTATSCATGPVYEGAHIRCGVRASPGAIERVWAEPDGALRWAAIAPGEGQGEQQPIGLCGSGVISAVSALVDAGLLDSGGTFIEPGADPRVRKDPEGRVTEALLVSGKATRTGRDIVLTQGDVRNVQLGKAALRAGIEILLRDQNVAAPDRVLLAGTFGNHLDPGDMVRIGLVPPIPVHSIDSIGNAAGDGARLALYSRTERERAVRLAETIRVIELSGRREFQDLFVECTALDCVAVGEGESGCAASPIRGKEGVAQAPPALSADKPTVVISCRALQELLQELLPREIPTSYLEITLHNTPKKLSAALQQEIDAVTQPSNIIVGYGLCGNALVGVRSRCHTLIIPRTHDCVAIFLGSHQRYVQRFFAHPNTYYLTRGWLQAHDDPLHDYVDHVRDYDQETAEYLVEMKYRHYRRLCMIGFSQRELDDCRPMAMEVAAFCRRRWSIEYEETIGSAAMLESLLKIPANPRSGEAEFVVVPPGVEIRMEMFLREGEAAPQATARRE